MLISCDNLTVSYEGHPAIHHVSCHIKRNNITGIVGPNGAGKSTLLKAFLGLLKSDTGQVQLHGISYSDCAYLPQVTTLNTLIPLQVIDVVCLGAISNMASALPLETADRAAICLSQVGLSGFADRYITDLSKGELQRVMFAKIIMQTAKVVFLDEPFNAIDTKTTQDLLKIIQELKQNDITVVMVLHDLLQVSEYCDQVILLASELVAFGDVDSVLTQENLRTAYSTNFVWSSDICKF